MECPVCGATCSQGSKKCDVCDFRDSLGISRSILTKEEANYRLETIIQPYRQTWETRKQNEALQIENEKLKAQVARLNTQKIPPSYIQHQTITNKNDSINQQDTYKKPMVQLSETGGVVNFGNFSWRVLDIQNDKMLLLCERIVALSQVDHRWGSRIWEESTIRKYLNSDFLNNLHQSDINMIVETKNKNARNMWSGVTSGNDTLDKIFLLIIEEADKYFGNSEDYLQKRSKGYSGNVPQDEWRMFNKYNNDRVATFNGIASWWWLRTSGIRSGFTAYVDNDGCISVHGSTGGEGGIRPALWLKN